MECLCPIKRASGGLNHGGYLPMLSMLFNWSCCVVVWGWVWKSELSEDLQENLNERMLLELETLCETAMEELC